MQERQLSHNGEHAKAGLPLLSVAFALGVRTRVAFCLWERSPRRVEYTSILVVPHNGDIIVLAVIFVCMSLYVGHDV